MIKVHLLAPYARQGCLNSNHNDITHVNLGLIAVMKPVDTCKVETIKIVKS